jgi:hypothetical protein
MQIVPFAIKEEGYVWICSRNYVLASAPSNLIESHLPGGLFISNPISGAKKIDRFPQDLVIVQTTFNFLDMRIHAESLILNLVKDRLEDIQEIEINGELFEKKMWNEKIPENMKRLDILEARFDDFEPGRKFSIRGSIEGIAVVSQNDSIQNVFNVKNVLKILKNLKY